MRRRDEWGAQFAIRSWSERVRQPCRLQSAGALMNPSLSGGGGLGTDRL